MYKTAKPNTKWKCKSLTNLYTATFTKNTSYYNDEDILMGQPVGLGLWCLMPRCTIFQKPNTISAYIVVVG